MKTFIFSARETLISGLMCTIICTEDMKTVSVDQTVSNTESSDDATDGENIKKYAGDSEAETEEEWPEDGG